MPKIFVVEDMSGTRHTKRLCSNCGEKTLLYFYMQSRCKKCKVPFNFNDRHVPYSIYFRFAYYNGMG